MTNMKIANNLRFYTHVREHIWKSRGLPKKALHHQTQQNAAVALGGGETIERDLVAPDKKVKHVETALVFVYFGRSTPGIYAKGP